MLCRDRLVQGWASTARVQYAYIEKPKKSQIILSHPKTPTAKRLTLSDIR
jgi:hypothetical protein